MPGFPFVTAQVTFDNCDDLHLKGARSRCLILLVMSSKRQIGRARVFHLQNHGHITTESDFPAV